MYIKEILCQDNTIQIYKQRSSWSTNNPPSGPLYWNRENNRIEVIEIGQGQYTATKHELPSETSVVHLSPDTVEVLNWARRKMQQEQELDSLCQSNPALADLRDKFLTTVALIRQQ